MHTTRFFRAILVICLGTVTTSLGVHISNIYNVQNPQYGPRIASQTSAYSFSCAFVANATHDLTIGLFGNTFASSNTAASSSNPAAIVELVIGANNNQSGIVRYEQVIADQAGTQQSNIPGTISNQAIIPNAGNFVQYLYTVTLNQSPLAGQPACTITLQYLNGSTPTTILSISDNVFPSKTLNALKDSKFKGFTGLGFRAYVDGYTVFSPNGIQILSGATPSSSQSFTVATRGYDCSVFPITPPTYSFSYTFTANATDDLTIGLFGYSYTNSSTTTANAFRTPSANAFAVPAIVEMVIGGWDNGSSNGSQHSVVRYESIITDGAGNQANIKETSYDQGRANANTQYIIPGARGSTITYTYTVILNQSPSAGQAACTITLSYIDPNTNNPTTLLSLSDSNFPSTTLTKLKSSNFAGFTALAFRGWANPYTVTTTSGFQAIDPTLLTNTNNAVAAYNTIKPSLSTYSSAITAGDSAINTAKGGTTDTATLAALNNLLSNTLTVGTLKYVQTQCTSAQSVTPQNLLTWLGSQQPATTTGAAYLNGTLAQYSTAANTAPPALYASASAASAATTLYNDFGTLMNTYSGSTTTPGSLAFILATLNTYTTLQTSTNNAIAAYNTIKPNLSTYSSAITAGDSAINTAKGGTTDTATLAALNNLLSNTLTVGTLKYVQTQCSSTQSVTGQNLLTWLGSQQPATTTGAAYLNGTLAQCSTAANTAPPATYASASAATTATALYNDFGTLMSTYNGSATTPGSLAFILATLNTYGATQALATATNAANAILSQNTATMATIGAGYSNILVKITSLLSKTNDPATQTALNNLIPSTLTVSTFKALQQAMNASTPPSGATLVNSILNAQQPPLTATTTPALTTLNSYLNSSMLMAIQITLPNASSPPTYTSVASANAQQQYYTDIVAAKQSYASCSTSVAGFWSSVFTLISGYIDGPLALSSATTQATTAYNTINANLSTYTRAITTGDAAIASAQSSTSDPALRAALNNLLSSTLTVNTLQYVIAQCNAATTSNQPITATNLLSWLAAQQQAATTGAAYLNTTIAQFSAAANTAPPASYASASDATNAAALYNAFGTMMNTYCAAATTPGSLAFILATLTTYSTSQQLTAATNAANAALATIPANAATVASALDTQIQTIISTNGSSLPQTTLKALGTLMSTGMTVSTFLALQNLCHQSTPVTAASLIDALQEQQPQITPTSTPALTSYNAYLNGSVAQFLATTLPALSPAPTYPSTAAANGYTALYTCLASIVTAYQAPATTVGSTAYMVNLINTSIQQTALTAATTTANTALATIPTNASSAASTIDGQINTALASTTDPQTITALTNLRSDHLTVAMFKYLQQNVPATISFNNLVSLLQTEQQLTSTSTPPLTSANQYLNGTVASLLGTTLPASAATATYQDVATATALTALYTDLAAVASVYQATTESAGSPAALLRILVTGIAQTALASATTAANTALNNVVQALQNVQGGATQVATETDSEISTMLAAVSTGPTSTALNTLLSSQLTVGTFKYLQQQVTAQTTAAHLITLLAGQQPALTSSSTPPLTSYNQYLNGTVASLLKTNLPVLSPAPTYQDAATAAGMQALYTDLLAIITAYQASTQTVGSFAFMLNLIQEAATANGTPLLPLITSMPSDLAEATSYANNCLISIPAWIAAAPGTIDTQIQDTLNQTTDAATQTALTNLLSKNLTVNTLLYLQKNIASTTQPSAVISMLAAQQPAITTTNQFNQYLNSTVAQALQTSLPPTNPAPTYPNVITAQYTAAFYIAIATIAVNYMSPATTAGSPAFILSFIQQSMLTQATTAANTALDAIPTTTAEVVTAIDTQITTLLASESDSATQTALTNLLSKNLTVTTFKYLQQQVTSSTTPAQLLTLLANQQPALTSTSTPALTTTNQYLNGSIAAMLAIQLPQRSRAPTYPDLATAVSQMALFTDIAKVGTTYSAPASTAASPAFMLTLLQQAMLTAATTTVTTALAAMPSGAAQAVSNIDAQIATILATTTDAATQTALNALLSKNLTVNTFKYLQKQTTTSTTAAQLVTMLANQQPALTSSSTPALTSANQFLNGTVASLLQTTIPTTPPTYTDAPTACGQALLFTNLAAVATAYTAPATTPTSMPAILQTMIAGIAQAALDAAATTANTALAAIPSGAAQAASTIDSQINAALATTTDAATQTALNALLSKNLTVNTFKYLQKQITTSTTPAQLVTLLANQQPALTSSSTPALTTYNQYLNDTVASLLGTTLPATSPAPTYPDVATANGKAALYSDIAAVANAYTASASTANAPAALLQILTAGIQQATLASATTAANTALAAIPSGAAQAANPVDTQINTLLSSTTDAATQTALNALLSKNLTVNTFKYLQKEITPTTTAAQLVTLLASQQPALTSSSTPALTAYNQYLNDTVASLLGTTLPATSPAPTYPDVATANGKAALYTDLAAVATAYGAPATTANAPAALLRLITSGIQDATLATATTAANTALAAIPSGAAQAANPVDTQINTLLSSTTDTATQTALNALLSKNLTVNTFKYLQKEITPTTTAAQLVTLLASQQPALTSSSTPALTAYNQYLNDTVASLLGTTLPATSPAPTYPDVATANGKAALYSDIAAVANAYTASASTARSLAALLHIITSGIQDATLATATTAANTALAAIPSGATQAPNPVDAQIRTTLGLPVGQGAQRALNNLLSTTLTVSTFKYLQKQVTSSTTLAQLITLLANQQPALTSSSTPALTAYNQYLNGTVASLLATTLPATSPAPTYPDVATATGKTALYTDIAAVANAYTASVATPGSFAFMVHLLEATPQNHTLTGNDLFVFTIQGSTAPNPPFTFVIEDAQQNMLYNLALGSNNGASATLTIIDPALANAYGSALWQNSKAATLCIAYNSVSALAKASVTLGANAAGVVQYTQSNPEVTWISSSTSNTSIPASGGIGWLIVKATSAGNLLIASGQGSTVNEATCGFVWLSPQAITTKPATISISTNATQCQVTNQKTRTLTSAETTAFNNLCTLAATQTTLMTAAVATPTRSTPPTPSSSTNTPVAPQPPAPPSGSTSSTGGSGSSSGGTTRTNTPAPSVSPGDLTTQLQSFQTSLQTQMTNVTPLLSTLSTLPRTAYTLKAIATLSAINNQLKTMNTQIGSDIAALAPYTSGKAADSKLTALISTAQQHVTTNQATVTTIASTVTAQAAVVKNLQQNKGVYVATT